MLKFTVAYWCRPIRNLQSMQSLFQVGREVVVSGCIIDFDMSTRRFIVEVNGGYVTSL